MKLTIKLPIGELVLTDIPIRLGDALRMMIRHATGELVTTIDSTMTPSGLSWTKRDTTAIRTNTFPVMADGVKGNLCRLGIEDVLTIEWICRGPTGHGGTVIRRAFKIPAMIAEVPAIEEIPRPEMIGTIRVRDWPGVSTESSA